MKLIDKIQSAQTKDDLNFLSIEIILDKEHFVENQKAFIEKLREIERRDEEGGFPY